MSISVIIPVLNEEKTIGPCLDRLSSQHELEVLIIDGGNSDKTINRITQRSFTYLTSPPGRGTQQHTGAKAASKDILLFLHSDTKLPCIFAEEIQQILQRPGVAAGAFQLQIDCQGFFYTIIEDGVNIRSRYFRLPYGDQALFMYRQTYESVGGFSNQPIMEDIDLIQRLKKKGKIELTSSQVLTSARRWQNKGILRTLLINQIMLAGWMLGIPPRFLAQWYYNHPAKKE